MLSAIQPQTEPQRFALPVIIIQPQGIAAQNRDCVFTPIEVGPVAIGRLTIGGRR
jgi:hypothetical protein